MTSPPVRRGVLAILLALVGLFLLAPRAWQAGKPPATTHRPVVAGLQHAAPRQAMPKLGRSADGRMAYQILTEQTPPAKPAKAPPEPPFYVGYLKNPASLGFSPDGTLFDQIYHMVKTEHFDRTPDDKLYGGVIKEVGSLLKEDQLSPAPVEALKPSKSAVDKIVTMYGDKVDKDVLWYAMIRGMLAGTGDPYTVLMTPKEYGMLMEQMQNQTFGGVGIYLDLDRKKGNVLTVVEPLEGTPAYVAGLQAGDQIIQIDGKPTKGMTLDMATAHIRGPVGSQVVLTIRRPDTGVEKDYAITRGQIEVASVSKKMLPNGIGYIRLRLFGAHTGEELAKALDYVEKNHAKSLIFDLRNNGGGYINAAIDVCSNFIQPGNLVTYVMDRHGVRKDYDAVPRPRVKLPMVLLVNQFSASASEITSGCLKDYHRAELIGVKTFGKGSVQQLYPLPSGAALKLTIAHFFTPKGHKINKVGVLPNEIVKMAPRLVGREGKDVQLVAAEKYLESAHTASR